MSISIEAARRKIDIIEILAENPHLVLTELFTEAIDGCNFLYQIHVDGKYIFDYLIEHLEQIPVFSGCTIRGDSHEIFVFLPSLKWGRYQEYQSEDKILKMDLHKKTFRVCSRCLSDYEKSMEEVEERKEQKLSDWWSKFENLNAKKRLRNAIDALYSEKKIRVRIMDVIFWVSAPEKRIETFLKKEQDRVKSFNRREAAAYEERVERQQFYRTYAPAKMEKIQNKQRDIAGYLNSIGFQEDPDMYDY